MGSRANVRVHDGDGPAVYLYTHWGREDLAATVRTALARKQRWDDDQYLARIIFDAMTEGRHGGETGFGITAYLGDGASHVIDVDTREQKVKVFDDEPLSFADFVRTDETPA